MAGGNCCSEVRAPRTYSAISTDPQQVDDHPEGYPQLAAFQACDPNFLICRKYGWLRNRVLLYRQDELNQMERRLLAMDDEDKDEYPIALYSRKMDDETRPDIPEEYSRRTLIMQIDEKLKQYGKPPSMGMEHVPPGSNHLSR